MKEVIQRAGVSSPAQAEAVLALRDEFDKAQNTQFLRRLQRLPLPRHGSGVHGGKPKRTPEHRGNVFVHHGVVEFRAENTRREHNGIKGNRLAAVRQAEMNALRVDKSPVPFSQTVGHAVNTEDPAASPDHQELKLRMQVRIQMKSRFAYALVYADRKIPASVLDRLIQLH